MLSELIFTLQKKKFKKLKKKSNLVQNQNINEKDFSANRPQRLAKDFIFSDDLILIGANGG